MLTKQITSALLASSLAPIPAVRLPADTGAPGQPERNSLILNAAYQLSGQSGFVSPSPSPARAQHAVPAAFGALE